MRYIFTVTMIFFLISIGRAQIMTDFEDGTLAQWRSEGDGQYVLEAGTGNPGNCMRVNDDATGDWNIAIAPIYYLGDWSTVASSDSLMTDVFVNLINGTVTTNLWVFRISGPGGSANGPLVTATVGQWMHVAIAMDSSQWIITSGTWKGLMQHVNHFEVRAEYISGDEYVLLDNIGFTFSPLVVPVQAPVASNFESGAYEGWTVENTNGISIPASGGNPGRYLRITDGTGLGQAVAPPKFLGDWRQLDNQAAILFDLQISNFTGPLAISDFLLKISGPGGEATIPMDSSITNAFNRWYSFSYMLSENDWTLVSGSWQSLLADVRELRLVVEYINGSEIVWLDNFRVSNDRPVAAFSADPLYIFIGESVQFSDLSQNVPTGWAWQFGDGGTGIDQDPIHTYNDNGRYDVRLIVSNAFGRDTLLKEEHIQVAGLSDSILYADNFNDNKIHPAWWFNNGTWVEQNATMVQNSNYYQDGLINGAYALVGSSLWKNYKFSVDFRSTDNDGIGTVFNYQDENNFYLLSWRAETSVRTIRRFVNGVETSLAADTIAYVTNQWYHLDITTVDGQINVYVDSAQVYSIYDDTFLQGKAGLYCWANQSGYWDNFIVENLDYVSVLAPEYTKTTASTYTLKQNYPNPFNPATEISFSLPSKEKVILEVYNSLGQKVKTLINREISAGVHALTFDATTLPSGIYFYRIMAGDFQQVRKMVLVK